MTFLQPQLTYPAAATACALVGSIFDVKSRRIPNFITMPAFLFGLVLHLALGGWRQLLSSLAAGLICGLVFLVFYLAGGMGAGDVKLCAAIGAWIGPGQLLIALVIAGMAGGIMVLCWAAFGGFLNELFTGAGDLVFGWKERGMQRDPELVLTNPLKRKMPYAPAIAIGTLISFFSH